MKFDGDLDKVEDLDKVMVMFRMLSVTFPELANFIKL